MILRESTSVYYENHTKCILHGQNPEFHNVKAGGIYSYHSTTCCRIPYPFVRAVQYPCSIVIKPTVGDFLQ